MREPDIATLARRLAEQNNVDWRTLSGTGPDGKIVERDVLDYLARVMAGEEAVDPTPEPLPEGMEAWPDQDAPAYFRPNGSASQARGQGVAADDATELLADLPGEGAEGAGEAAAEDAFAAQLGDAWEGPVQSHEGGTAAAPDLAPEADVFAEPDVSATSDDLELSDDIFLFDDDEDEGAEEADPDTALLVADDDLDAGYEPMGAAPLLEHESQEPEFGATYDSDDSDDSDDTGVGFAGDLGSDFGVELGTDPGSDMGAGTGSGMAADSGTDLEADIGSDLGVEFGTAPASDFDTDFGTDPGADRGADLGTDLSAALDADLGADLGGLGAGVAADGAHAAEPDASHGLQADQDQEPGLDQGEVFAPSLESYDHDFTTPSERFGSAPDVSAWGGGDLSDLGADEGAPEAVPEAAAGDLPDLWVSDAQADAVDNGQPAAESADDALQLGELGAEDGPFLDAGDEPAPELDAPVGVDVDQDMLLDAGADAPEEWAADAGYDEADDVADLEQAAALDELDAVADLEALEGEGEAVPAAAFSDLPLARTGNVLRRHVDLSALANAQLAAGRELGHDEPLSPAPFLLRAVAKAAAELGSVRDQVALAELGDGVRCRRVDDAAGRSFASLVQELAGPGPEEDELGLVAVDLSGFDMDEVVLDLEAPAVTLGRVLYDTQRGAHRSTLTLSGELPLPEGAKLLARVAELLEAPIRLLL